MGRDKALLPFLGQPLVERLVERLRPLSGEMILVTNRLDAFRYLNLPMIGDKLPGRGALGGLFTALSAASRPLAAVVACDMPFASPGLLSAAVRMLVQDETLAAVIPTTEYGAESFHAVYRRAACLPAIQDALQQDKWRVDAWFEKVNIRFLLPEETAPYDPEGLAFMNLNTPEEWARVEALARDRKNI